MNSLKDSFPRIFVVATRKFDKISDFGRWHHGVWEWNIQLRIPLFDWEKSTWSDFLSVLNKAVSIFPSKDRLKWSGASHGRYSMKDYCIKLECCGKSKDPIWRLVWFKFAPPKVATFVWKVVHQRIPVTTELQKRGVRSIDQPECVFCKCESESISHVLCHCGVVWQVWQRWCKVWTVNIVIPKNVKQLLQVWFSQIIRKRVYRT
ncbi:uncharacterized protein LOC120215560 [Hibiscus syriacus]|uniref:uncharacterized protein LOC120215560 n=1 Tax=Hibiscus syriacus TaxID=106335 RepID=UPI001922FD8B|nr:uncharacterized protein LOC120215560 [Hibiscus syriacus]